MKEKIETKIEVLVKINVFVVVDYYLNGKLFCTNIKTKRHSKNTRIFLNNNKSGIKRSKYSHPKIETL